LIEILHREHIVLIIECSSARIQDPVDVILSLGGKTEGKAETYEQEMHDRRLVETQRIPSSFHTLFHLPTDSHKDGDYLLTALVRYEQRYFPKVSAFSLFLIS
jgi:hypothetical protein